MKKIPLLDTVCQWIVIVAAIDWGLIALFKFDLISKIFGFGDITRIIYIVVGAAGVYLLLGLVLAKKK
jgi:uncharacterized protein